MTLRIYPATLKINNDVCNVFQVLDRKSAYLIVFFRVVSVKVAASWDVKSMYRRIQFMKREAAGSNQKLVPIHRSTRYTFQKTMNLTAYLIFNIT